VVDNGRFREDLFYRLNVLTIRMPALSERLEDLPALARYFSRTLAAELHVPEVELDDVELARLRRYSWPGNVRELRNLIECSLLLGRQPSEVLRMNGASAGLDAEAAQKTPTLAEVETAHVLAVLEQCKGNKSEAARRLDIGRKTLERKLRASSDRITPASSRSEPGST
jgi:DNA-binding NtrC family response regulator